MDWWRTLYDEHLASVLLSRDEEIEATVRFLLSALEVEEGARIFDQCCGNGRLSNPLSDMGFRVVGVDLIENYIRDARRSARLSAEFFVGDAFTFSPPGRFDAAFNWWTSFGYADEDARNRQMLSRAFEALRPGGRFALDFFNLPGLLRGFRPQMVNRSPDGATILIRDSEVDLTRGRLLKRWLYLLPNGRRVEHESAVRLYMPHDLIRLFEEVGFEEIKIYGDLDGAALSLDSPRCLVVGRRPSGGG